MTKTPIRLGFLFTLIAVAAFSWPAAAMAQEGGEGPTTRPSPEAAAPIFQSRCTNCHGLAGKGDGPQAAQANLAMPDLTESSLWRETTPARWFDIISNGVDGKAMPPFGENSSNPLRQIDRWNLVFYLYTLGTPPAQVGMGQALYEASCVECHDSDGTPGFTDPVIMANQSQADLFSAIADTTIEGHDLGLGDVEIRALTDYVRTFSYNYAAPSVETAPSAVDAPAAASPFSGGPGVISGRIVNATPGGAIPDDLVISLRAFDMNADLVDSTTTTVDTDGTFRFEDIDPALPVQYEPLVVYENVPYFGELDTAVVLSPEQPEADVNISIYETTEDPDDIRIERLHIVLDFAPDRLQVAELYILSNDGQKTFVGTLEKGTLPIVEPDNALSFQPGGDPSRYLSLADGIADTMPVPPGQSTAESIVVYDLAYDGNLELSRPLPYDVSKVNVFVPAEVGIKVSGDALRAGGPFEAQGASLDTYLADDLAAGDGLTLRVSGEAQTNVGSTMPSPVQSSGPDQGQGILAGLIALVGAVALAYLYWQGHLSLRFRPITENRQSALLQDIADLDDDYETGRVKEEAYQVKRAALKEELVELMEAEQ
jgi:mono/diheme cytochrome c family protein